MTKKQWILLVVAVLAGGGFLVDRVYFGEPESAQAKTVTKPSKSTSKTKTTSAKPAPTTPLANDPSLAYLEKLADPRPGRDVFAPSPSWIQAQQDAVEQKRARSEEKQGPRPGSPEAFELAHKLQATTVMENGGLAVVDGQCLSVGDMLEDFQLARVQAGEAEFRRGHEYAVLRLPMGPGAKSKTAPPTPAKKSAS